MRHWGRRRISLALLFGVATLAIVAMVFGAISYLNRTTNTDEYQRLIDRVQSAAALIDSTEVDSLAGSREDLMNPTYLKLKSQLITLRDANADLRFAYLMRKTDDHVYFLADSEPLTSPDYSPPGQEYTEASPALLGGWNPGIPSVLEIYTDRWGTWISALAPIVNASGTTVALIGFDEDAHAHELIFTIEVGLVILAALMLFGILVALYYVSMESQDFADMKTDFVAAASHELRTPLASIRWTLATLRSDKALSGETRSIVDDIYRRVCMLIEASNTFLVATSVDHGVLRKSDLRDSDIAPMLSAALDRAREIAEGKGVHIDSTLTAATPIYVPADTDKLRLTFDNLLSNAIKYSPTGSHVTLTYVDRGHTKIFTVADHGIGIPAAEIALIFKGFTRASNARLSGTPGTGFGLYMTKRIIDFHGGTIVCASKKDGGTSFTITLPGVY